MQLSEHFTLDEFTFSQTASRYNIDNTPGSKELENLQYTALQMESVRDILKHPISISSAYRSLAVNRAVGSTAKRSQHLDGCAVDFTCAKFGTPRDIVKKIMCSNIKYDQLILEFDRWVHISFVKEANRKEVLVIDNSGTRYFA
jgi:hypothetical protein